MVDVTSVDIVAIVTELNIVVVTKSSNLVAGFLEQPYKFATTNICYLSTKRNRMANRFS